MKYILLSIAAVTFTSCSLTPLTLLGLFVSTDTAPANTEKIVEPLALTEEVE